MEITLLMVIQVLGERQSRRPTVARHTGHPAHRTPCTQVSLSRECCLPVGLPSWASLGLVCLLDGAELGWKFASLAHSLMLPLWAPSPALLSTHLLAGFPRDPEPPNHSEVTIHDSLANILSLE